MPLLSQLPVINMSKRKFIDDLPIFCKRAKLVNTFTPPNRHLPLIDLLPTPPPSPVVALALRQKRKRSDEPEADINRHTRARRNEPTTFHTTGRLTQPHSLTPRSKWTTLFRSPDASSEEKGPAPGRRWEQLTARLSPPLTTPSSRTPALSREPLTKRKDKNKKKNKSSCKATKTALAPHPARLKNQLLSPANTPRKKKASRQVEKRKADQQEGKGGQRR